MRACACVCMRLLCVLCEDHGEGVFAYVGVVLLVCCVLVRDRCEFMCVCVRLQYLHAAHARHAPTESARAASGAKLQNVG